MTFADKDKSNYEKNILVNVKTCLITSTKRLNITNNRYMFKIIKFFIIYAYNGKNNCKKEILLNAKTCPIIRAKRIKSN